MEDTPTVHIPTVWVVNYAGHDYSRATEYGPLDFLTSGYVSMGNLERLFFIIAESVNKTKADDYLLLSGLLILNTIAAMAWLRKHKAVRFLLWDQKIRDYRRLTVTADQIDRLYDMMLIAESNKAVAEETA